MMCKSPCHVGDGGGPCIAQEAVWANSLEVSSDLSLSRLWRQSRGAYSVCDERRDESGGDAQDYQC